MSILDSYEEFKKHKWLAVYGASFALQVADRMLRGHGAPDDDDTAGLREEAAAVADLEAAGDAR